MATDEARRSILSAIRRNLAESAPHDVVHAQRHEPPNPSQRGIPLPVLTGASETAAEPALPREPLARFRSRLEAVAGTFTLARGDVELSAAIERILAATGARRAAASDSPGLGGAGQDACARAGVELLVDASPAELFDCDVGISAAQWGIAETGTLVLESRRERHRFVSLLPRVHVALLSADRICETLGEALRNTREGAASETVPSAVITLVTGPSRTSDIELTLAIGVHGPQELHVIVTEPAEATTVTSAASAAETPDPGRTP